MNKTAIGDYLGEKKDFNEAVLKAFVELHDFTDLILVQALRQFLWSFRLPGKHIFYLQNNLKRSDPPPSPFLGKELSLAP